MPLINICLSLLLAVGVFLAVRFFRRQPKRSFPKLGALRVCPHCGMITARAQTACLECGKAPAQVS
jgi:hypothetical protein